MAKAVEFFFLLFGLPLAAFFLRLAYDAWTFQPTQADYERWRCQEETKLFLKIMNGKKP